MFRFSPWPAAALALAATTYLVPPASAVLPSRLGPGVSPQHAAEITSAMERTRKVADAPSLAVAIVKGGKTIWSGAVGYSDYASGALATADTLYTLGSVSKSITASTVMSLYEDGAIGLDDGIGRYLHQPVEVPAAPGVPITFRQLLSHTSGIADSSVYESMMYSAGDFPLPLDIVVSHYVLPGGFVYSAERNFTGLPPGVAYEYSNVGYGLVGAVAEVVAGSPFTALSKERVLDPLGMVESGWLLADIDTSKLATSYLRRRPGEPIQSIPFHGLGTYPDGSLRSSANELALFLAAQMTGGGPILEPASVALMQSPQAFVEPGVAYGLGLDVVDLDGLTLIGHEGSDPGCEALMYFIPELDTGAVILTNVQIEDADPLSELLIHLIFLGASL